MEITENRERAPRLSCSRASDATVWSCHQAIFQHWGLSQHASSSDAFFWYCRWLSLAWRGSAAALLRTHSVYVVSVTHDDKHHFETLCKRPCPGLNQSLILNLTVEPSRNRRGVLAHLHCQVYWDQPDTEKSPVRFGWMRQPLHTVCFDQQRMHLVQLLCGADVGQCMLVACGAGAMRLLPSSEQCNQNGSVGGCHRGIHIAS